MAGVLPIISFLSFLGSILFAKDRLHIFNCILYTYRYSSEHVVENETPMNPIVLAQLIFKNIFSGENFYIQNIPRLLLKHLIYFYGIETEVAKMFNGDIDHCDVINYLFT